MTRILLSTAAAAVLLLLLLALLPVLPLLPPATVPAPAPQPIRPTATGPTVASLRAIARRRGLRSAGGRPIASARRANLLAALAA